MDLLLFEIGNLRINDNYLLKEINKIFTFLFGIQYGKTKVITL